MVTVQVPFQESRLGATPIRDLGLTIAGTDLERVLQAFDKESERLELRLRPHYYLSTEWGVPFGTISIAIPFYLARQELTRFHAKRAGHIEGSSRADILRYLRHEFGHVVNYAYKLYETEEWIAHFGAITRPYKDDFRPEPFSPRFVRHLPGWYAQKHPDEDWAETFAVWMTPRVSWRKEYADAPEALAKLMYCDRTLKGLKARDPAVTATELDEDVGQLGYSLEDFYRGAGGADGTVPPGLDGALQSIFEEQDLEPQPTAAAQQSASSLIRRLEPELLDSVYRWTGHFPERTRVLVQQLAERADQLGQFYRADREATVTIALTTLVTALAMNHVYHGNYVPSAAKPT